MCLYNFSLRNAFFFFLARNVSCIKLCANDIYVELRGIDISLALEIKIVIYTCILCNTLHIHLLSRTITIVFKRQLRTCSIFSAEATFMEFPHSFFINFIFQRFMFHRVITLDLYILIYIIYICIVNIFFNTDVILI